VEGGRGNAEFKGRSGQVTTASNRQNTEDRSRNPEAALV